MNVDQLLPQVKKLISDNTLKVLSAEGPKMAIKGIYNILPGPIRLFVKEEAFITFCLSHQDKLFGKATPKKAAKKAVKKSAKSTSTKKRK